MSTSDLPNLNHLRGSQNWERLEHRYYLELNFLDIMHSIDEFHRKRATSSANASLQNYFAKAYVDNQGHLLRIDNIGSQTAETYILYKNALPGKVYQYITGKIAAGKKIEDDFLSNEWTYQYNENDTLIGLVWHWFPDLEFRYSLGNDGYVYYSYEYDQQGLSKIFKAYHGLSLDGKAVSHPKVVIYDRHRNDLLAQHTISRTAWIPVARKRKISVLFMLGGPPPVELGIPKCSKCGKALSYVCQVELIKPFKNQSKLPVIPIFYCFDCLEPITTTDYHEAETQAFNTGGQFDHFPTLTMNMGRSATSENQEKALIKLGGMPDWVQDDEFPSCPKCGKPMMFVCQINSAESFHSSNLALIFGDSGRLYTFACCDVIMSIMQCY